MNTDVIGLTPKQEKIIEQVFETSVDYSMEILGAVALLVVGWMLAGWVRRMVMRGLDRLPNMDETLKPFIGKLVWYVAIIFVIVAVLNQFGIQTTSIIAVLGAAGLAIGLALQGTLANVAAGVMLLFLRPFNVGDYVDAGGDAGTVVEIGLFNTELRTFDGLCRMIPNAKIWGNTITNYTRNPTRRIDIPVGISYSDDVEGAMAVLLKMIQDEPLILKDPAPEVMVKELADSAVVINLRGWAKVDDYWAAVWEVGKQSKLCLEAAGYSIPFPQRDLHVITGDAPVPAKPGAKS